jgi:two-component system cell cycle sensor histidine kinase/response regulator CckA
MSFVRDRRFLRAVGILGVVWVCGVIERVVSIQDGLYVPMWMGDLAGLIGALLLGGAGRSLVRDLDISLEVRRILLIAWLLFVTYSLSDVLDEFAFPPDNPLLGKRQFLHRAVEIFLWSSGFVLTVVGLFAAILDSGAARRAAKDARERGDASIRENERTREQLDLFAHAIEQSTEAFVLMAVDGTITYANPAFERLLLLPSGHALGRTAMEMIEDHHANPARLIEEAREKGSWSGEVEAQRTDGQRFQANVMLILIRDRAGVPVGIAGLARDVTERVKLEAALRASEERYRIIAEQATDLISTHTRDSEWLYVSPSVESILGYTPEELVGNDAYDIMDPSMAKSLNDLEPGDFLDPQPEPMKLALRHKEGHVVHLESRIRTVTPSDPGAPPQILVMSRDVSERLRHEEERRQLDIKLHRAQRHESLTLLAGGVAHDFNNLLLVILANTDLVLSELGPQNAVQGYLRAIQTAAEHAGDLTRQMLAYTGKGQPNIRPIQLGEAVDEMAALLQASVPSRIRFERALKPSAPEIRGDITEIRQVVMNLITNATEAIGHNDGIVRIATGACQCDRAYLDACVVHEPLPEGAYSYVEVTDTGAGMDEATRERIFDPFFTTKFTGRGLGLASVLGIVRRHRGTVWLSSIAGEGTTIRVLFPAAEEPRL